MKEKKIITFSTSLADCNFSQKSILKFEIFYLEFQEIIQNLH